MNKWMCTILIDGTGFSHPCGDIQLLTAHTSQAQSSGEARPMSTNEEGAERCRHQRLGVAAIGGGHEIGVA